MEMNLKFFLEMESSKKAQTFHVLSSLLFALAIIFLFVSIFTLIFNNIVVVVVLASIAGGFCLLSLFFDLISCVYTPVLEEINTEEEQQEMREIPI